MENRRIGGWGERLARWYLVARGYRVVARSWRAGRYGEIDLVVRRGNVLAFVEVKTRRGRRHGRPEDAVGPKKQRKLVRLAEAYRAALPPGSPLLGLEVRLDVVAVERRPGRGWTVRHLPGAFDASAHVRRRRG